DYIENLVNDKNAKIESAWDEYKALETRSRKAEIAAERLLRDSEARAEAAEDRLQALQEALDAAHAESARLTDEKQTMEERALGSEQAFADLESAMNELRAAHAAELEALRTAHAEELSAIYAERSTQLDKKTEQIRAYQAATKAGLDACVITEKQYGIPVTVVTDYNSIGKLQYIVAQMELFTQETLYTDVVTLTVLTTEASRGAFIKKVTEATSGKAEIIEQDPVWFCMVDNSPVFFSE
ncbi:MAG: DUF1949 domain-containing protein, partial [Lachnospiraceae bacterium]|nr:DUF1949 domain-containing protein [Lachnospiraceae bacterium]